MHGNTKSKFSEKNLLRRKSGPKSDKLNSKESLFLVLFWHLFPWRWRPWVAWKRLAPIIHWGSFISQKKRELSFCLYKKWLITEPRCPCGPRRQRSFPGHLQPTVESLWCSAHCWSLGRTRLTRQKMTSHTRYKMWTHPHFHYSMTHVAMLHVLIHEFCSCY